MAPADQPRVAIVHDYLTQRGGAERVVASMLRAFPDAALYTSLYDPPGTFPEFADVRIKASALNRVAVLRRHHRLALPFLAPVFSRSRIDAEALICSSSGWAHGVRTDGAKIVYCYSPARWLYQTQGYLGDGDRPLDRVGAAAVRSLGPWLRRWDRRAMESADRVIAASRAVAGMIAAIYGIEAEVVYPPVTLDAGGSRETVPGIDGSFFLCVARLLPYKRVDAVIAAFELLPDRKLVVVGDGPLHKRLLTSAPPNVVVIRRVTDSQLRWLYATARGLVSAAREDFGLTPLEAAAFGCPSAVLRDGGYCETVVEGKTGEFFERPAPELIARAVRRLEERRWASRALQAAAAAFGAAAFEDRLHRVVTGVLEPR
jgi:glycosyltransferase involved in cell wall biosynthesis